MNTIFWVLQLSYQIHALVLLTYLNVSEELYESGPFEPSEPVETNHKPGWVCMPQN